MGLRYAYWQGQPAPVYAAGVLGGSVLNPGAGGQTDWPLQHLRGRRLGRTASLQECWLSDGPVQEGRFEGIHWRRNASCLYGVIELDEQAMAVVEGETPLQVASRLAYERLFRLMHEQRVPHLWRVWNYVGGINAESHGLERYRQFNLGRHQAFERMQRGTTGQVPAACALGWQDGGPLSIAFLAGLQAPQPIENPRQVSAYHYPGIYGPRAPTFSRAVLVRPPGQDILFISGTASIVGHETLHQGDVVAQCHETVRNLACVVDQANLAAGSQRFSLKTLEHRVYLRHADDEVRVREALALLLPGAYTEFVLADVCRADLLVEIESMGICAMADA